MNQQTFWLTTNADEAVFVQWFPVESSTAPSVVLCHPIGPEYMHCHTSLRQLALQLQVAGVSALTFDLPGYGNSSGQLTDAAIFSRWQQALTSIINWVSAHDNVAPILLALRTSCLLTPAVAESLALAGLVWWYPQTRGQTFVRDLQLIDVQLHSQAPEDAPCLTGGGYPMHRQTATEIEKLSLSVQLKQPLRTLIIHTPEQKRIAAVADLEAAGSVVQRISSPGLPTMARQAETSVVPQADIESIIAWVLENPLATSRTTSTQGLPSPVWSGAGFSETSVQADNVFGVITRPLATEKKSPWVVIPNTGAGHHAGPNRLHVDLARRLANQGVTCVRMDLRHLGDSPQNPAELNNDAYNLTGRDDIAAMIRALSELGLPSVSLLGLCAGAYNCFQAALAHDDLPVAEIFLINAQTLYWEIGDDSRMPSSAESALNSAHYNTVASDPKAWLRLIISPRKWLNVAQHIVGLIGNTLGSALQRLVSDGTTFERDLKKLTQRGIRLRFVFSPGEPGMVALAEDGAKTLQRLQREEKVTWDQVAEADHTFTTEHSRQRLIDHLVNQLC